MAITTLFFDVGGVLLTNGWDRPDEALCRFTDANQLRVDLAADSVLPG